jgi:histidyl-tRNA synthetase
MTQSKAKEPAKKPVAKATDAPVESSKPAKGAQPIQLVRGMRDILPSDQLHWKRVEDVTERIAGDYGFDRIDTPLVEDVSLFVRGVGKVTDIVEKELFQWETPGGEQVALRPEATAPIMRAYIQHGMLNQPQPLRLWTSGPMFRYDRPQAGRFRQFFQNSFEVIGEPDIV